MQGKYTIPPRERIAQLQAWCESGEGERLIEAQAERKRRNKYRNRRKGKRGGSHNG